MIRTCNKTTHHWAPSFSVLDALIVDINVEKAPPTLLYVSREYFDKLLDELRDISIRAPYPIYPTSWQKGWPLIYGVEIRPEGE